MKDEDRFNYDEMIKRHVEAERLKAAESSKRFNQYMDKLRDDDNSISASIAAGLSDSLKAEDEKHKLEVWNEIDSQTKEVVDRIKEDSVKKHGAHWWNEPDDGPEWRKFAESVKTQLS